MRFFSPRLSVSLWAGGLLLLAFAVGPTPTHAAGLKSEATETPSAQTARHAPASDKSQQTRLEDGEEPILQKPTGTREAQRGTLVRWYGHAFVYLISRNGIRIACDPFGEANLPWAFPDRLPADFVFISNESEAHAAGERLAGAPQVFRSIAAVGINRSNNIVFRGVATPRDETSDTVNNTVFACTLDDIRFVHLGLLGQPLTSSQVEQIGQADVLFAPIGYRKLSTAQWLQAAKALGARILVPTVYRTPEFPARDLRTLEEFVRESALPVTKIESNELLLTPEKLPAALTVYQFHLTPKASAEASPNPSTNAP